MSVANEVEVGIALGEKAALYGILSEVFRRPLDGGQIARFRDPTMRAALNEAGVDLGPRFASDDEIALRHALAVDYTQLFHSPANSGDRISPYEGLFTGAAEDLNEARTDEVRHFMGDVGFEVAPGNGEMADHVSVELAFLAELTRREDEARAARDDATADAAADIARRFLSKYPGRWVGDFARRVEARAETTFYASMAHLLAEMIALELAAA